MNEEHKLTDILFKELLFELAKNEPKLKMSAGSWILIRKKISKGLKLK